MQALLDPRRDARVDRQPRDAPYGRAAEAALHAAGVYDRVKTKIVLGDNVAQAMQFVQSGAADVGIVALSLALAPTVRGQGRYWQVPPDLYPRLEQGGVILKSAADVDAARRVRAFLLARTGRRSSSATVSSSQATDVDWTALWLSVRLSLTTTALLILVGIPIAYWMAFSPWRGKFLVEAIVALPLVLPPTVLGFYVLVAMGPPSPLGRAYAPCPATACRSRFRDCWSLRRCTSCRSRSSRSARRSPAVDRRLLEASWSLGVSRWATFVRVVLPLSIAGLVTGIVLSFAHTLGEFGVVLMVGGNLPGETRTVSISIYDAVQSLDYAAAGRTSLLLLAISFVVLAVTYATERSVWAAWPGR